jgi:hypothetical protein
MSQSGYTPIQLYRTTTAAAEPTAGNLAAGELAINLTDEKLFFKNADGTVKLLASTNTLGTVTSVAASGGTTGLTFSGSPITTSGTLTLGGTLGVANGGTGTATAFTAGSVVFAGASGVYSQDNANLFWDNANGRLGIGTSTPSLYGRFAVYPVNNTGSENHISTVAGTGGAFTSNLRLGVYPDNGALGCSISAIVNYTFGSGTSLAFGTTPVGAAITDNPTERMRIDPNGNLLVGTTLAGGRVSILAANNTSTALITRGVSGDVATASTQVVKFDNNSTGSQIFTQFLIDNGNTGSGLIAANGGGQAAFASFSDAELKENITDLPAQLDNVLALRPVEFDYIESEGGGHQIGFIAQEIEQVFPDAVGEREDGMKTVAGWTKTEAILVKAIQELTARVAQLEGN